jgi:CRISPR-associated protein Cmr3
MTLWIVEPRDPLLVRDGRPFGSDPGARASSLPFPFPSTIAGGIRSRAGVDKWGVFHYTKDDKDALHHLKALRVRGPLLVRLAEDGEAIEPDGWFLPAPGDAILFPPEHTDAQNPRARIQQLVPLNLPPGAQNDLSKQELWLVGLPVGNELSKPLQQAPVYWHWHIFKDWLLDPSTLADHEKPLSELGGQALVREQRLHVSIDADKATAKDGMLFETSGLEFTAAGSGVHRLSGSQRLALAVDVDDHDYTVRPGLTGFGGERRTVIWRESGGQLPACPADLAATIAHDGRCRICLLTPACFQQGYRPTWLLTEAAQFGIKADLKAIAVQRPQVVSGWDFAENKPKSSRRLAPAGTVLFLTLEYDDKAAIEAWVKKTWMQCISDEPQDRTDGFGLAVLGSWSTQQVELVKGVEL